MGKMSTLDEVLRKPPPGWEGQATVPASAAAPRARWQVDQAVLLEQVGFDRRKYGAASLDWRFKDARAEEQFRAFLEDLPRHMREGAWLYLLGGKGVGKTMAMARVVLSAPLQPMVFVPGEGTSGRYTQPTGTIDPDLIRYHFAPDVADDFAECATTRATTSATYMAMTRWIYLVDDIHRWLELGGYVRENVLAGWDAYTERRNGHGLTVVSANLFADEIKDIPQFKLGLDRARERGLILDIRGESERGHTKTD